MIASVIIVSDGLIYQILGLNENKLLYVMAKTNFWQEGSGNAYKVFRNVSRYFSVGRVRLFA